jgi:ComF family protein
LAALRYEHRVVPLIRAFKFRGDLYAGVALAHLMLRQIPPETTVPDCLVPVPLHRRRLAERGFNQSLELTRTLGRVLKIPVNRKSVTRIRDRAPQSQLTDWTNRWRNVRDVFHVKPRAFQGLRVTVVDDVMTSGATAHAMAMALKQAGASSVSVWVLARAGVGT